MFEKPASKHGRSKFIGLVKQVEMLEGICVEASANATIDAGR